MGSYLFVYYHQLYHLYSSVFYTYTALYTTSQWALDDSSTISAASCCSLRQSCSSLLTLLLLLSTTSPSSRSTLTSWPGPTLARPQQQSTLAPLVAFSERAAMNAPSL